MRVTTSETNGAFKMTSTKAAEIFLKKKTALKKKIAAYTAKIDREFQPIVKEFIATLPVRKGKVYELVENGSKRKGFKRFVIYMFDMQAFARSNPNKSDMLMVRACGWWLDEKTSLPAKWDAHLVFGASNSAIFKLSDNQKNGKVPEHLNK